jgi:predicted NAD/FAD-dependent oxidoreductase
LKEFATMPFPLAIVGSGITGLCLGNALLNSRREAVLIDKGRRPGGRMASFATGGVTVEVGPKWFHTPATGVQTAVSKALESIAAERVAPESLPASVRRKLPVNGGFLSWRIVGGLRRFTTHLAEPLDIRQSLHVRRLEKAANHWRLLGTDAGHDDAPFVIEASGVVLTMPWPQAIELLSASGIGLPNGSSEAHADGLYDRQYVAIFSCSAETVPLSHAGFLEGESGGVLSLAMWRPSSCPDSTIVLSVFAHPDWSRDHWDDDPNEVAERLSAAAQTLLGHKFETTTQRTHRWKYAQVADARNAFEAPLVLEADPPLIIAGDAFGVTASSPGGLLAAQESAALAFGILDRSRPVRRADR